MDAPRANNLHLYLRELKKHNVTSVVRVCEPTYPASEVEAAGMQVIGTCGYFLVASSDESVDGGYRLDEMSASPFPLRGVLVSIVKLAGNPLI